MGIGCASVVVVAFALAQAAQAPVAQSRPDFSGQWVVAETASPDAAPRAALALTGIFGERFTAKQTATTLSLELSVSVLPKPLLVVYALDGSESKNMNPSPVPGGAEEPIYSTAKWDGNRLVIDTRGTRVVEGKVQTSRRVISLTPDGLLLVERSAEGQPTTRSAYRRAR